MTEPAEIRDLERLDLVSGSAMHIVAECAGQPNLKAKIPPEELQQVRSDEDEEWAARGNRIHKAFQTDNTLMLNPEELETYRNGIQYLEKIKQKWIQDKALDPANVVEGPRELRGWLYKPYAYPELMGSAQTDRHFFYDDGQRRLLLVLDLKSGWNPNLPPSSQSWQLKFELITLVEEYGKIAEGRVAYVKAKDKHEYGDYCDYSEMDLKYSFDSIAFHSWQSTQPDAPRHAGEHCRWCPCKAHCPEALAFALLPSTIARDIAIGKKLPEVIQTVSMEDLYRLWQAGSTIRNILDAVVDRLKGMSDEKLAEIALVHGKGREIMEWTDIKGALEFLRDEKKWDENELWKCLEFGLGKLGKLATKEMGVDEKHAAEEVKKLLQSFTATREGAKILRKLR